MLFITLLKLRLITVSLLTSLSGKNILSEKFNSLKLRRKTMSNIDIIRAWKDEEYRNSLSEEQRSQLPKNPAGIVELSDADMEALAGGFSLAPKKPTTKTKTIAGYVTCTCSC
jgi:mersacidin/lichenicidin family type 2 lantibiotic